MNERFLSWWLAGVVVISLIIMVAVIAMFRQPSAADNSTVGEAIARMQSENGYTGTVNAADIDDDEHPGYRLVELAASLGLPEGSLPQDVLELGVGDADARRYFVALISKSVEQRELTPLEAEAVIKAYDRGLVDMPVHLLDTEIAGAAAAN